MNKNVLADPSAEPAEAHWDRKIANEWNIRNETCPDIIKLKHVRNGGNVIVCRNQNKNLCCEAGDAINKLCASQATKKSADESTWDAVVHQVKPAVNEKQTIMLC